MSGTKISPLSHAMKKALPGDTGKRPAPDGEAPHVPEVLQWVPWETELPGGSEAPRRKKRPQAR